MLFAAFAALALGTAGCATDTSEAPAPSEDAGAAGETTSDSGGQEFDMTLNGAGASFPAPLYQSWFSKIQQDVYPGLKINYQSVGSGAGVEQYLAGTVDFGASDAPLTDEEKSQFSSQYGADPIQVPMTGGLVVFAYNLSGVDNLQLSREDYCGIVSGDITSWDDPAIVEANPDAELPSEPINFVHRSDGSGTTFLFTNHIQAACPNWTAGAAKTVDWPVGVGAKGNEGIAAQIQQTNGSIGYVEYTYANENNISMASLENQAGNYIEPSPEAGAAVLEGQEIPDDFALTVPDPEGDQAYPIVGLTWMLLYPEYDDPQKAEAINAMVEWALQEGDEQATELGYIPLTEGVQESVVSTVKEQVK
ncbi:phosphate ABC transporter substrate-binding protein PstS [Romeria aff. gracilis LEGE 07310]|uniref:Phosphate-binding protein n=2 Tax=Vasconcelosia TaxID=3366328 RepID=A0A8J7AX68_9CYAN|nr:phosphate ABC transporter substrate-binding protein PstS [Romeria aff. gracilis LEGE 07310]